MFTLPIKHIGQGIIQVDVFHSGVPTLRREVFHVKNVVKASTEPRYFTIVLQNSKADVIISLLQSQSDELQSVMDQWVAVYREALRVGESVWLQESEVQQDKATS